MKNKTCEVCGNELRTCGKCGWSKVYEEDMGGLREQVEQWKGIVEKQHLSTIKYKDRVEQEIEQLKAQNAALLECVNFYAGFENGMTARACLKQIEEE